MKRSLTGLLAVLSLVAVLLGVQDTAARSATPEAWCSALAAGDPILDVLSDSVGEGVGVDNPSYKWHGLLGDALRSDGAPNTQVWTGGAIPGSATADYVPGARYSAHTEFTIHHPDLIIMGWGINDWAAGIPVETFRAQYQTVIDRVRELSPDSTLVLVHHPWVYNTDIVATRGPQTPYRDVIRELAHLNGAYYLGMEWPYDGTDRNAQATPDRVHLNANGQNTQFALMWALLHGLCGAR